MTESIAPKSDQLNAEDLLTGPRTFTIAEVRRGSAEQPIDVHLVEFPGRPFKPSKTVRRIMVGAWGADAAAYAGRRMTLYRDPTVRFGGQDVGGIRVSHMSDMAKPMTLALTVTRGKRVAYVVQPLADKPAPASTPNLLSRTQASPTGLTPRSLLTHDRRRVVLGKGRLPGLRHRAAAREESGMSTGAEHYAKAEHLLTGANGMIRQASECAAANNQEAADYSIMSADTLSAMAQVHATLALAAATVQDADWFDA